MFSHELKKELHTFLTELQNSDTVPETMSDELNYLKFKVENDLQFFDVTSVSKGDLKCHFNSEEVDKLTDEDMEELADKMGEYYVTSFFWDDMVAIVKDKFNFKEVEIDEV